MSLNKQVATGAIWMVGLRLFVRSIGFISTIILARLLTPEDFGLVAIIMSFFALIEIFGNFGFDTVLIQKQNATADHYNTAWSFNFCFGLIAFSLVVLLSGFIADFYENQKLQPIMLSLAFLFLITGFQNIGVVDFRKNLTFEKEFKFQIIPKLISFFCTIGMAFWLRNYWALVFGSLIWKGCLTINSYLLHSFRPKFNLSKWRELFNFSKWLMVNNLFYFLNTRSPEMVIGKILVPQSAGFFSISQEISTLPTTELASNINRAVYPGYSKVSHQLEKLKEMYLQVMQSISFMVLPAGLGIAAIAETLVPVVLGSQWQDSVSLVKYLAVAGALLALNTNTGYVFLAMGEPRVSSLMGLLRVIIFIPCLIFFTYFVGLQGAALSVLLTTIMMFFVSNALIKVKLKIPLHRIFMVHIRPAISSSLMFFLVYSFQQAFWFKSNVTFLCISILVGALAYALTSLLLWRAFSCPDGPEKTTISLIISRFSK